MPAQDAVLFAGQGSASLFTHGLSDDVRQFVSSSVQANNFLLGCLSAFRLENIALYVHQILGFLRYAAYDQGQQRTVVEVSGFCSGLVPAVVVAASLAHPSERLHQNAIEGFRLVFWIGVKVAQYSKTRGHILSDDAPWSLVVSGLDLNEISELVREFNQVEKPEPPLCIASVLSDRAFSLSARGHSLQQFKVSYLPSSIPSRPANVHGYYHGGTTVSTAILNEVIATARRRNIEFPDWDNLTIPIRSTHHGSLMTSEKSQTLLLQTILDFMLMQRVEWQAVSSAIVQRAKDVLGKDASLTYRVVGIEPNAKSLLSNMKTAAFPRFVVASSAELSQQLLSPKDIAIVGVGMKFPSGDGQAQFWSTIREGLNVVTEIPSSRFNIHDYHESENRESNSTRKTKSKYGNFIDSPFDFDNGYFQISPREAKSMDPQQRILLHTALDALQDAGYSPDASPTFQKDSFGVYVGVATGDYVDNSRDNIDVYYSTGTLRAFLSGRISYAFGFGGPSVVIDTACSSSLVALYQACRSLQNEDCKSALAGGVNVISSPDMQIGLSRAHFLSETGQCKPFDAAADGYCRAEGCGVFVLKRAVDAIAEGDRIHGIIRGIEVNQCGTSKSITHPDASAQEMLFKKLFSRSGIQPDSINVIEAHGTGTQAGDYAEINSIRAAFGPNRKSSNPLYVSSVKGNIGHVEAASGTAGLSKLLLMMRNQQIPPQAAHQSINPRLGNLLTHNIVIPRGLASWDTPSNAPRRALLNNFGAAGSNAGLILEEYWQPSSNRTANPRSNFILNISAKTAGALQNLCQSYYTFAETAQDISLKDFSYSASARKIIHDQFRISIGADCLENALKKLKSAKVPETGNSNRKSVMVFVFSGQGGVYQGMGSELLATAPVFQQEVRRCDEILEHLGYAPTEQCLLKGKHALDDPTLAENTIVAQCACFVLEYALAKLWFSFGVIPDIAVGHSLGEYAMLAVSGAITLHDALFLVAKRAELMYSLCDVKASGMMACNLPSSKAEPLLAANRESYPGLVVACKNSSSDCVIAGPSDSLSLFGADCKASGVKVKRLEVPYGFHSSAMDPILQPFDKVASSVAAFQPKFAIVSSTLGRIITKEDLQSSTYVKHAREAVDFAAALEVVKDFAVGRETLFVEIGPAPKTLPMVKATLNVEATNLIPSLRPSDEAWVTMTAALSSLFMKRQTIVWTEVFRGSNAKFIDIPPYPLSPSTFLIPYEEPKGYGMPKEPKDSEKSSITFPFLKGSCVSHADGAQTFDADISLLAEYIKSHAVGGVPLCPASVYMELAAEASDLASQSQSRSVNIFRDISFNRPLIYQDGSHITVLTKTNPSTGSFTVSSGTGDLHCTGVLEQANAEQFSTTFLRDSATVNRQLESVSFVETFSSRVIYDIIFPRVVKYTDPFRSIKQLHVATSGLEGFGTFQISRPYRKAFNISPTLVDTLLHAAGFIANIKVAAEQACICVRVEDAVVPRDSSINLRQEMTVYCSLNDGIKGYLIADAYALDADKNVCAVVRGMHFKILSLKAFQAQLARAIGTPIHTASKRPSYKNSSLTCGRAAANLPARPSIGGGQLPSTMATLATGSKDLYLHAIQRILSELCQIEGIIDQNARLEDLGMDSLLFIEMRQKLVVEFPALGGAAETLEECSTVLDVFNVIQNAMPNISNSGMSTPALDSMPSPLQSSPTPEIRTPAIPSQPIGGPMIVDLENFLKDTCGFSIATFDKSSTLDSLGVDSLLSIEIEHGLRESFGVNIDTESCTLSSKSIEELERIILGNTPASNQAFALEPEYVSSQNLAVPSMSKDSKTTTDILEVRGDHTSPSQTTRSCVTLLQKDDSYKTTLYLFHDGSGLSSVYSRISKLPCNVVGVSSVDFDLINTRIQSLEDLARDCIARVDLMGAGDFILGGWSFGGVLAFEISRQLRLQGKLARGVILIDSPVPLDHDPLPNAVIEGISSKFAGRSQKSLAMRACIEAQFKRNARLLGKYSPSPDIEDAPCVMLQCAEIIDTNALYGVHYPWLCDEEFRKNGISEWEQLIGKPIPVYATKGNHFDLFNSDNVVDVSNNLGRAILLFLSEIKLSDPIQVNSYNVSENILDAKYHPTSVGITSILVD